VPAWAPPFEQGDLDTRSAVVRLTQEVIREAARGDAVIVGRGSAYVLRDHPHALHVFLHAPTDVRVRYLIESLGLDEPEARKRLKETDANRAAGIRQLYGHDWWHPSHYDLAVDTSRLGFEATVETVLAAVRSKLS
jgi:cytidylate kinase